MAEKQSVQSIKKEKREKVLGSVADGMSRRRFLTYLGTGSAALAAGSAGVLTGCSEGQEQGQTTTDSANGETTQAAETTQEAAAPAPSGAPAFFTAIEPTDEDEVVLAEGFRYDMIRKWEDPVIGDRTFGFNNDFVAYFPVDALDGGDNSEDGILWVNHEYTDSRWVAGSDGESDLTAEQVEREKEAVGGSVIRVRREGDSWQFVEDEEYNRRIDANTPMDLTGPAAGSEAVQGATEVIGTLANCSGGVTPWNTVLSCEENFQFYYGERTPTDNNDDEATADATWLNATDQYPPEHYGWVVEIDPFDPESKPRKHSWLGRVRHENVAIRISDAGRVVAYTGHDQEDECIYKFISSGTYSQGDRESNLDLLTDGMLYVADFSQGRWVAMDFENNPIFRDNGFADQADVLTRTAEAAKLSEEEDGPPIGTPMDRCEDIEVHPDTGTVYCALTNNASHGNFHGQVLRLFEQDGDPEATEFAFEVFAAGGPNTGFSSPDNLAFDNQGNLWVVTDVSSSRLNQGIYTSFQNNGMFVMPDVEEKSVGDAYQFASGPVECEMTGPFFTPDGRTMFIAVQHPGEESESVDNPSSTWPDGDIPRPSVIAITGGFA